MILRSIAVIPAALLMWWLTSPLARPDETNWLYRIGFDEGWWITKLLSGLICFAVIVVVGGCLALLYRRSPFLLVGIAGLAWLVGTFIAYGYASAFSEFMSPHVFVSLVLSMTIAVPMCFAEMLAGKQVDIVGDE